MEKFNFDFQDFFLECESLENSILFDNETLTLESLKNYLLNYKGLNLKTSKICKDFEKVL